MHCIAENSVVSVVFNIKILSLQVEISKKSLCVCVFTHRETWEQEIADLREERDRLKKEVEEGSRNALREEVRFFFFFTELFLPFFRFHTPF